MNPLVFSAVVLCAVGAMGQFNSFYAGAGRQYPRPFTNPEPEAPLDNRFAATSSTAQPSRIDNYGHDVRLVQQAQDLPSAQQPFWVLNRDHIRKHLGLAPAQPAQPTQPAQPAQPARPAQPAQSAQPTQPARPAQPAQSAQPTQPARPAQPAQPAQPQLPAQPAQANEPVQPIDDVLLPAQIPNEEA